LSQNAAQQISKRAYQIAHGRPTSLTLIWKTPKRHFR